jgi:O-antigen ligase
MKKSVARERYQAAGDVLILGLTFYVMSGPDDQYSATAVASLAVGLTLMLSSWWIRGWARKLVAFTYPVLVAVILVIGIAQPFFGGSTISDMSSNLGRDTTLTGRTEIWNGLIPDVEFAPLGGSGFASFWTEQNILLHDIGEAHNGYLDLLLDRGAIGILLLSSFLFLLSRQTQKLLRVDIDWGIFIASFLIMTLIHNVTESSINSLASPLTAIIIFLAMTISCARPHDVRGASENTRGLGPQLRG